MHQKIKIRFSKKGALRFLSHQDMMRLLDRAIRRSGLPIKMSQGFNPKPQFSYILALGNGIESEAEVVVLRLSEWTRTKQVKHSLGSQLPAGIEILDAAVAPADYRPVASSVSYKVYNCGEEILGQDKIDWLIQSDTVAVQRIRKGRLKTVNIRPFIRTIARRGDTLEMVFDVTQVGTANPFEVLKSLGVDVPAATSEMRIVRTELS